MEIFLRICLGKILEVRSILIACYSQNQYKSNKDTQYNCCCLVFSHKQNPRYISHYLRTHSYHQQIKKYVSSAKISAISADGIGKAIIPLPSLEEQERIASILDKFEALTTSLSDSLPAEIKARQQQYEFYRDQLLTFKRAN